MKLKMNKTDRKIFLKKLNVLNMEIETSFKIIDDLLKELSGGKNV